MLAIEHRDRADVDHVLIVDRRALLLGMLDDGVDLGVLQPHALAARRQRRARLQEEHVALAEQVLST